MPATSRPSQHFAGLDLLRFYAALCVVVWHATTTMQFGFMNGWDSVTLFFVLSGFLITYLLLVERSRSGDIDLLGFYVRRTLRIYPLYLVTVIVSALLLALPLEQLLPLTIPFAANFVNRPNLLAHAWSIGAEEQFYLVYPILFRRFGVVKTAFGIIIARQLILIVAGVHSLETLTVYDFLAFQRFDAMAIGALFAWALFCHHPVITLVHRFWYAFPVLFLLFTLPYSPIMTPVKDLAFSAVCAGIIINIIRLPVLDTSVARLLGNLSYAMYMLHVLVLLVFTQFFSGFSLLVSAVAATLVLAWLSYRMIESPFLRLKLRFRQPSTVTSPSLKNATESL